MAATLTVVGSSDAFNAGGRTHSCYLLEGDGFGPIMIDFGATALAALRRRGRAPRELTGLALTHLHGDHIGGMPFLIIDAMFNDVRSAPLPLVTPVGGEARYTALMQVTYGDILDKPRPFAMPWSEIAPGQHATLAGVTVHGFAAQHMDPPEQPLCLRIEMPDGRSVAFSGDTELCDGLMAAADGAELLVAECSALAPPCGRHCHWEGWREALPRVKAKRVLLTHLGEAVRARVDELLAEAPAGVDLAFADDGLVIAI